MAAARSTISYCRMLVNRRTRRALYTKVPKHRSSMWQSMSTYQVDQERLDEISKSPSGWVPPQSTLPSLPFQVKRSRTNNLPVYIDKKRGGSLTLTVIRNIKGDIKELEALIGQQLGPNVHLQCNEITSQLKIKGYHKDKVVQILKELGF